MNWTYIGIAALLPLTLALAATLLAGAVQALRLHHLGGSSRVALGRFLRTLALVFPVAFLAAALWDGRATWRGLAGAAAGRAADQRALGLLRAHGEGFLAKDPAKAAAWFRKAAEGGDARAQYWFARTLAAGTGVSRDLAAARTWAEAAARQGDPDAMVLAGDLSRTGDPATADRWYQEALATFHARILRRDPGACLAYGLLITYGKGAPRDPMEGVAWMKVAERLGLKGLQVVPIRLAEAQLPPAQRAEAATRTEALLKSLPKGKI